MKEVIQRAQQAENENVIHRCHVETMQRKMDTLKNTVQKLHKERYPSANTESLRDTSSEWVESIVQENQRLKGESQQS